MPRKSRHPSGYGYTTPEGYHLLSITGREKGATVAAHIYAWEQAFGAIPEGCVLHHKNGDRQDNRIENLEAMPQWEHVRQHLGWTKDAEGRWQKQCPSCGLVKDAERDFYWHKDAGPQHLCKPCHTVKANTRRREREEERRQLCA